LRLAGQGAPGLGREKAGDLFLEVNLPTHPLYRVEDRDNAPRVCRLRRGKQRSVRP
jgi:hypothetical protein